MESNELKTKSTEKYQHTLFKVKTEKANEFLESIPSTINYVMYDNLEQLQAEEYAERILGINFIDCSNNNDYYNMNRIHELGGVILEELECDKDYIDYTENLRNKCKEIWKSKHTLTE